MELRQVITSVLYTSHPKDSNISGSLSETIFMLKSLSDLGKNLAYQFAYQLSSLPAGAQDRFVFGFPLTLLSWACHLLKEVSPRPLFYLAKLSKTKLSVFPLGLGKEGVSRPCSKLRKEVSFPP